MRVTLTIINKIMEKGLTNLAGAVIVVGLAWVSVYAWLESNHEIGWGWAVIGGLAFFFYGWRTEKD